jgi:cell division protein FtsI/penicillin-binding protein 2
MAKRVQRRKSKSTWGGDQKKSTSSDAQIKNIFAMHTRFILFFILVLAGGIIFQIIRWQIFEHPKYLAIGKEQYSEDQRLESGRGSIKTADGTILATDQPSWDVYASLSSIDNERVDFFAERDHYVDEVSLALQIDRELVNEKITEDFRYVKIASGIETDIKKTLENKQIFQQEARIFAGKDGYKRGPGFGLYFEKTEKRIYPDGNLASHVVGFMGKDDAGEDIGLYGIEGYYFGDLAGTAGYTYEDLDASGNVILTSEYDPLIPRSGKDITLSIQSNIQTKVEKILKEGVERYQAKSGTVIILDPNTGAVIAMANYPDYNPNEYWRIQDPWIFKNKAIGDVYEPGSVFKPITVAIGLETGTITPETECNDNDGELVIYEGTSDEKHIYTWDKKPDGLITPRDYLRYSNNPCIAQTAMDTGHEKYYPIMREFGIGEYVGIGLQDETNAYLLPFERWTILDLAVTSFGQSVSVTPLQMISAISAIANEGKRMRPYIVQEVTEGDDIIKYQPSVASQPISAETAATVAEMMTSVPRQGDGSYYFNKYLPDYDISGKTGTAQIPKLNEAGYYDKKTNTTFVGFAPSQNAQMAMIIKLEEPKTDPYSANTVVPLWVEMFLNLKDDLEIPKKK